MSIKDLKPKILAIDVAFVLISVLTVIALFAVRKILFFRDYSIIWDGAVRMLNGASPFSDFGMPTGPVSLYIPYVFLKLFGINWFVFQLSQLFQSALIILSAYVLLRQLGEKQIVSGLSVLALSVSYLVFQTHPWYNVTATLLLLVALNLAVLRTMSGFFLSGLVTGICFFCKQDFGALTFGIVGLLILFYHFRDRFEPRKVWRPVLYFVLGFGLIVALALCLYDLQHFLYWFNLGHPPHARRALTQWDSPVLGLAACLLVAGVYYRAVNIFVYGLICLVAAVTSQTSGLYYTHYYFVFVVPAVIYNFFIDEKTGYGKYLVLLLCYLSWIPTYDETTLVAEGIANGAYAPYYAEARRLKPLPNIVNYTSCSSVLHNVYGPEDSCRLIRDLQKSLTANKIREGGPILNMTELTPLNHELGLSPPVQHPLWYHLDVSLFEREKKLIFSQVGAAYYDVVLVQAAHGGPSLFHRKVINMLDNNPTYERLGNYYLTPASLTDCGEDEGCRIYAFVKKLKLSPQ